MFPRDPEDDRPGPATGQTALLPLEEGPCPSCVAFLDQLDGAAEHASQHLTDRDVPVCRRGSRQEIGWVVGSAGRPRVLAREPVGVRVEEHREAHVGVEPPFRVADVLGIDGEAGRERLARGLRRLAETIEGRPRPLGVHEVDRHG